MRHSTDDRAGQDGKCERGAGGAGEGDAIPAACHTSSVPRQASVAFCHRCDALPAGGLRIVALGRCHGSGSPAAAARALVAAALLFLPPAIAHGRVRRPRRPRRRSIPTSISRPCPISASIGPIPPGSTRRPRPMRRGGANKGVTLIASSATTSCWRAPSRWVLPSPPASASFPRSSTNEGKPANAAQINRRAHEDEALVRELSARPGRYDGNVASNVAVGPDGGDTQVKLTITPGEAYQFGRVTLPGLDAAGTGARALRDAFTVKEGDPVDANAVNTAIAAFRIALGREAIRSPRSPIPTSLSITRRRRLCSACPSIPARAPNSADPAPGPAPALLAEAPRRNRALPCRPGV